MTKDEVIAIQRGGMDWLGQPLLCDGDYGPRTQWWHYITTLHPKRQQLVMAWLWFHAMGTVKDDGNNRGTWPDRFMEPSGLKPGGAWCIAFMSYCLHQCNADWPVYHASTFNMLEWAKTNGRITTQPKPGDIHCFMYPRESKLFGKGHGGGVIAVDTSWVAVCDGNVGDTVKVGKRARDGLTFIRTVDDEASSPAVANMNLQRLDGWKDR